MKDQKPQGKPNQNQKPQQQASNKPQAELKPATPAAAAPIIPAVAEQAKPEVQVETKPAEVPAAAPVVETPKAPEQPATTTTAPAAATTKTEKFPDRLKKSTVANPVKTVWELAEKMIAADPTTRRKDVVKKAMEAGVALYTARTQYQLWYSARMESQRNAAKVQAAQAAAAPAQEVKAS